LTLADGTSLTLQAYEPASDLALLRSTDMAGRTALPLRAGRGIRLADSVLVAGFPLTGIVSPDLNVTTGNVSALSGPDGNRALFQITAPVQSGNSGGPVLDQAGNLVGVVVSKLDAVFVANLTGDLPQNVNFGISLGTLQTFLDANNVDYSSRPSTSDLSNASVAEAARSATFQVVCY
jgi:S1-C subfamily serine protease